MLIRVRRPKNLSEQKTEDQFKQREQIYSSSAFFFFFYLSLQEIGCWLPTFVGNLLNSSLTIQTLISTVNTLTNTFRNNVLPVSLWLRWETWVRSMGWEDPLEKGMATHSRILVWRFPWTEEPGRLQSTGSKRVRHDWATFTFTSQLPGHPFSQSSRQIKSTITMELTISINDF